MKKFFLKAFIFVLIIASYLIGVIYIAPVSDDTFLAASIEKHKLLEKTEQPRIIFIGGSNLAFGLDSALIKEKTGYNVVNMGLHGGLGPQFYVNEVIPSLRKNDIVIIVLEHLFYNGSYFSGRTTLVELSIFYPKSITYYSMENYKCYFENIPITFQRRLRGLIYSKKKKNDVYAYRRSGFNEVGDYVAHLDLKPKLGMTDVVVPHEITPKVVDLLNDFKILCDKKGVNLFITFSCLLYNDKIKDQVTKDTALFYKDFKKKIKIENIGTPYDFLYPQEYFHDTIYHLNVKGREIRTRDLINRMKEKKIFFSAEKPK